MRGFTKSLLSMAVMGTVVATSVQAAFPLRVDIDVSTKRSKKNIGAGDNGEAKVENITVTVFISVFYSYGMTANGYSSFSLEVHVVKHLSFHIF